MSHSQHVLKDVRHCVLFSAWPVITKAEKTGQRKNEYSLMAKVLKALQVKYTCKKTVGTDLNIEYLNDLKFHSHTITVFSFLSCRLLLMVT